MCLGIEERELPEANPFEPFVTAVAHATRSTYHTTLKASPGQLAFGRDMILPINIKADWAVIAQRKQELINKSNMRENSKRINYNYKPGDKVMVELPGINPKLSTPRTGPYVVSNVNDNGTITINKDGVVTQPINIRRVTPYFD